MHTNLFEEPFPVGGGTPAVLNQCVLLTFRRASFAAQRARNLLKDVLSWGPCLFTNLVYAALFSLLLNFFSCLYNAAYCLFVCDIFVPVFVWFFSPLIFYFFWESSASTCIQVKAQIRETKSSSSFIIHIQHPSHAIGHQWWHFLFSATSISQEHYKSTTPTTEKERDGRRNAKKKNSSVKRQWKEFVLYMYVHDTTYM